MESKNHDYDGLSAGPETPVSPEQSNEVQKAYERLIGATARLLELEPDLSGGIKYYDLRVSDHDWLCFTRGKEETAHLIEISQFILGARGEKTLESTQAVIDLDSRQIKDESGALLDTARAGSLADKTEKLLKG